MGLPGLMGKLAFVAAGLALLASKIRRSPERRISSGLIRGSPGLQRQWRLGLRHRESS